MNIAGMMMRMPMNCSNLEYQTGCDNWNNLRIELVDKLDGLYEKDTNTCLAARGALAHHLHCRTAALPAKSKMAGRGPQHGQQGLERGLLLGDGVLRSTFAK